MTPTSPRMRSENRMSNYQFSDLLKEQGRNAASAFVLDGAIADLGAAIAALDRSREELLAHHLTLNAAMTELLQLNPPPA